MGDLDGWAISIGESTCRYLAGHGHDGLRSLFCSDGAYSAGWRVVAAVVAIAIMTLVLVRGLRPNH